ncbi:hypothetical protein [Alkalihalobacterium chitinilyticum]|uniref:Uncharacterized protein n=1 Tax=Alkalihalobacterium chitinilyticum TaxID=2980103 RepID=A0ABT5VKQ8_9BACI|nr:hypothetical protein [Alkalihalobacterium chitinilyticum]MDE5416030.1 hypothetical protein [Alkalihalobacterium chitinilyticum]
MDKKSERLNELASKEWLEWQRKIIFDEYIKPELQKDHKVKKTIESPLTKNITEEKSMMIFPTQKIYGKRGFINDP